LVTTDEQIKGGPGGAAWIRRADDLAEWAERWVNRTDCWGAYTAIHKRGKQYIKDGRPAVIGPSFTRKGTLTTWQLRRHFRATAPEHVIGLHTTAPDNTSRWGKIDIDQHGDTPVVPEANLAAALAWYAELARRDFHPLLTDSNGRGGFHLGFLLTDPAPTANVFAFLRRLTADYKRHGLTAPVEVFPKQAAIKPGGCGNWLRLPGRHHTRDHWSTVWDGSRWLAGEAAVEYLLGFTGDPAGLVPDEPAPPRPPRPSAFEMWARKSRRGGGSLPARIAAYLAKLPNLGEGQGRDDVAYHFAAWMVRDLGLSDSSALVWLERWDAGNSPPKGRERLAEILANAHRYGRNVEGCGLASGHQTILRGSLEVW
jgi:hypothetical protein